MHAQVSCICTLLCVCLCVCRCLCVFLKLLLSAKTESKFLVVSGIQFCDSKTCASDKNICVNLLVLFLYSSGVIADEKSLCQFDQSWFWGSCESFSQLLHQFFLITRILFILLHILFFVNMPFWQNINRSLPTSFTQGWLWWSSPTWFYKEHIVISFYIIVLERIVQQAK